MSNQFEGNLAKKMPANASQLEADTRSSGIRTKDGKTLEEFDSVDLGAEDDFEDLSSDDLKVDDGIEELGENDFEVDELNPVDVSNNASRKEDAMEGLNALARADRRQSKRGISSEDLKVVKENPLDISSEEVMDADDEVQMIDAKGQKLAGAFGELQRRDIDKSALESAKNGVRNRIAQREENIARLDKSTKDYQLQKSEIEADSAKLLEKIEAGSADMARSSEASFEAQAQPKRDEVRRSARESALAEIARENEPITAQLEKNSRGEIVGLKNLEFVGKSSFIQAMAGRMKAINDETAYLNGVVRDNVDNDRLKALQDESAEWVRMYQDVKMMEDSGVEPENMHIKNRFYSPIDVVVPEGLDKTDAETIAIAPEDELEARLEVLNDRDKQIDKLLQKAGEALWEVDDTDMAKSAQEKQALSDFLRGAQAYRTERKAMIKDKIALLEVMDRPEYLDVKSKKLNHLIQQSEGQISYLQEALKSVKQKGTMDVIKEKIDEVEEKTSNQKTDLEEWKNHPIRQEALNARHLDLQEKIQKLEMESNRQDWIAPMAEGTDAAHQSAVEAMKTYRAEVMAVRDEIHTLIRSKADIANERVAILNERIDRELAKFEYNVDLTDLNERVNGLEGIDVDTSAFDGEDVDLTDLNERVEGYKDIDVDTSAFGKAPKKASRVKKAWDAVKKKAA